MSPRRSRAAAVCMALAMSLASCAVFEGDRAGVVVATELPPRVVRLGEGLDEASASARLAQAASAYVLPPKAGDGARLPMRNRRSHEIRVKVDGRVARVDLVSAGGTSPIRHITDDRQLIEEYTRVLQIASRVLGEAGPGRRR